MKTHKQRYYLLVYPGTLDAKPGDQLYDTLDLAMDRAKRETKRFKRAVWSVMRVKVIRESRWAKWWLKLRKQRIYWVALMHGKSWTCDSRVYNDRDDLQTCDFNHWMVRRAYRRGMVVRA